MKKTLPILIAASIAAAALLVADAAASSHDAAEPAERGPSTGDCVDPPVTQITIIFAKGEIRVSPPTARTRLGNVLRFKLAGNIDATVYVGGKKSDGVWITGNSKHGAEEFYVCVDPKLDIPDTAEGKLFEYFVNIPGLGYLDPEVIVKGKGKQ